MKVNIESTPSIINNEITTVRAGQKLKYANLTAREKRDYLFDNGIRPTAYKREDFPDVQGGVVQFGEAALKTYETHSLSRSLTRVSDELDPPKLKLFHTYGSTAKIRFTPEQNTPYTGIFKQTACGLARFSYAGPVVGIGVVPALGLKFTLDGDNPSENTVAMRMLDSQQSRIPIHAHHSVFQNPFTNILPAPEPLNVTMQIVKKSFETVVEDGKGLHQPVDNLAAVRTSGEREQKVISPYRIIFNPTPQVREASNSTIDFRDDLARNIPAGTEIYEVFALDETEEKALNAKEITRVQDLVGHARKIGNIVTESEFIASAYGDYRLFFKHNADFIRKEYGAKAGATGS